MDMDNPDLIEFRRQERANFGLPPDAEADDMILDDGVSEATSATLRSGSHFRWSTPGDGMSEFSGPTHTVESQPAESDIGSSQRSLGPSPKQTSFIIATDFGTTFSSVAFAKLENGKWGEAKSIFNYPDDSMASGKSSKEVPTESWYPNIAILRGSSEKEKPLFMDDDPIGDIYNAGDEDELEAPPTQRSTSSEESGDEEMEDANTDAISAEDGMRRLVWGYGIQRKLEQPYIDHSQFERVERSKLMLDNTPRTQVVRDVLRPILNKLKRKKIIQKIEDVISDYLVRLFQHTKEQLVTYHSLSDMDLIEHVLCVPNVWSAASSRKMQKAMEEAIEKSGLGTMENLFIVAEPEAAAAYVLNKSRDVNPDDTFLIIDAGGGTVDLTTYTVHNCYPLRLKAEVSQPTGGLYGSSYLNQAFSKQLKRRLKDERYLETRGLTIDGIVDAVTVEFENRIKRAKDVTVDFPASSVKIQGLVASKKKNFIDHAVIMDRQNYLDIFSPLLRHISDLMKEQLRSAIVAKRPVKKVLLIGGFAGSPSLRNWLRHELKRFADNSKVNIRLINSDAPETAVALGAVLRAIDKEDGPRRITRSSYGFLRTEEYDENIPAHSEGGIRATVDKLDGRRYIRNTIDWLVKAGEEVLHHKEYRIEVLHTFGENRKRPFLCEEELWVSDSSTESHYRITHPKNYGAERAGTIVVDMTFLKDDGIIQPVDPGEGLKGKRHYKVEFELVMIVDGRNLRYEARWPIGERGRVQERAQISIAAAFQPGTN